MNFEEKQPIAQFRLFNNSDQCELLFEVDFSEPNIGKIKETIVAVRQQTDNVGSLLQHIKNKFKKILQSTLEIEHDKENLENLQFHVLLKRGKKNVKDSTVLKNVTNTTGPDNKLMLHVFSKQYQVVINMPYIKLLLLPPLLYANHSIKPSKFHAVFMDKNNSLFLWSKSKDKENWTEVGDGFYYHIKESDVNHFIKLKCIPISSTKLVGIPSEVISETTVDLLGTPPSCPFEQRHVFTNNKLQDENFRVVSYNILADKYAFTFDYCSPKALAIDYRKQLIFKELTGYNADVICLQEVDDMHYKTYFKPKFNHLGYITIYHRKGNRIPEGLACIFNKDRFRKMESRHIVLSNEVSRHQQFSYLRELLKMNNDLKQSFMKQSTSLQITVLKLKKTQKYLIVANTHLYYHPDADAVRLLQINLATTYLNMVKKQYLKEKIDVSVVFCGDFNSNPKKSLYPYVTEGTLDRRHEDCLTINENGKALLFHDFKFESACGTPKYTNYTLDYKNCLDYIFIETNKLAVSKVVPLTDEEELSKHEGLPNELFPSDHLALVVDLKFKDVVKDSKGN